MLLVNGECHVTTTPPRRLPCVDRVCYVLIRRVRVRVRGLGLDSDDNTSSPAVCVLTGLCVVLIG